MDYEFKLATSHKIFNARDKFFDVFIARMIDAWLTGFFFHLMDFRNWQFVFRRCEEEFCDLNFSEFVGCFHSHNSVMLKM